MSSRPQPAAPGPTGPECPVCGTTVTASAERCPECNYLLLVGPHRARPLSTVSFGVLAVVLAVVYLATVVIVAAAR